MEAWKLKAIAMGVFEGSFTVRLLGVRWLGVTWRITKINLKARSRQMPLLAVVKGALLYVVRFSI